MEIIEIEQLRSHIGMLNSCSTIEQIHKGYSADYKYLVTSDAGRKLLLRVMPIEQFARKQLEFQIIQYLYERNVKVPEPITIGQSESLQVCYYVLSYIEGSDARDVLTDDSEDVQYSIGVDAGRDLRKMHEYPAPSVIGPWYERITKKHRAYVQAYRSLGVAVKHADRILQFIEENEGCLRNRPNRFQHDDFHVGNLIVNDGAYAGAIDFNRYDWGDPLSDFLKVGFFSREVSVPFCVGQIHGYFDNESIPDEFWNLYSVYLAMTIVSSVVWTMRVCPHEMGGMLERIGQVLDDHRNFEVVRPRWYTE